MVKLTRDIADIAYERAIRRVQAEYSQVYDTENMHYRPKGGRVAVCGCASFVKYVGGHLPLCAECEKLQSSLVERYMAEEARNYWGNPTAGHAPCATPSRKTRQEVEYKQLDLPSEFLPTGTGQRIRSM